MWKRIGIHVAFWLFYLIALTYLSGFYGYEYGKALAASAFGLPVRMIAVYTILYVLLPRYVATKRYLQLAITFFLLCIIVVLINRALVGLVIHPLIYSDEYTYTFWNPYRMIYALYSILQIAGSATAFKLLRLWYQAREKSQNLAREKLESELSFLRSQINPHFLFNTLNNIYALSLKKSPHTSEVVMKLSKLLRFMLYECNSGSIPLEKELRVLEDYIDLEKIRYNERLEIAFTTNIENPGIAFPPMLLLPLVENGFKHGVDRITGSAKVDIQIEQKGEHFSFSMRNSKDGEQNSGEEGIGLGNTRRQLALLYPGSYEFKTEDEGETYFLQLKINLDHGKTSLSDR